MTQHRRRAGCCSPSTPMQAAASAALPHRRAFKRVVFFADIGGYADAARGYSGEHRDGV